MAFLDGPAFFRNSLIPTIGGVGGASVRRIPFTFTSTARLLRSGRLKGVGNNFSALQEEQSIKNAVGAIELETRGTKVAGQLGLSGVVQQFQNAAQLSVGLDMPIISMAINPQTIKWTQNKRVVKRDTMEGSVFFHFTNTADQNNDILTVNFSGKTGNINTQTGNVNSKDFFGGLKTSVLDAFATGAQYKLRIWHELYNMSREPMLLTKANTGVDIPRGLRNEFFITYRTVLMPVQVTLVGFFSQVLDFTESAADPYNRDYNFSFTVTNTSPALDDLAGLVSSKLTTIGSAQSLISDITSLGTNR